LISPAAAPGSWYAAMSPAERRTFRGCFAGWALDALDVTLYTFAFPALMAAWGVTRAALGDLASLTLLSSALGGWAAGVLCDRLGRVRTLQLTVLWFSAFTFLCGLAQSWPQFQACRVLMGLGFGGEWAAGAVLMGETIAPQFRGRAVGTVQSAWAVGWGAAALLSTGLLLALPPEQAWRAMFLAGLLPALLVFYLRRHVAEPPAWLRQRGLGGGSFLDIFRPPLLRSTLLAALLTSGAQGGYYALTTWLPSFLKTERHLSVLDSGLYLGVIIAGAFAGYLAGAQLADRIGRRKLFGVFALAAICIVLVYTNAAIDNRLMLALGFPLGFCASGYYSGVGPLLTELFPTPVRGSGQGFCYNFGRGVGAAFPALVGHLGAALPLGTAIAVFAAGAYALMFLAALLLPETAGRELG
jgi:MFS family permease